MTKRQKKTVDADEFLNTLHSFAPAIENESEEDDYENVVQRLADYAKTDQTFIIFQKEDQLVEKPLELATTEDLVSWANLVLPIGDWSLAAKECTTKEKKATFFFSIITIHNTCVFPSSKL